MFELAREWTRSFISSYTAYWKMLMNRLSKWSLQVICDAAKKASGTSLSAIYDAASIASELKGCNLGTITGAKETIEAASKQEKPTTSDLFYALSAAHILNLKVNYVDFTKALTTAFKDDSASRFVIFAW